MIYLARAIHPVNFEHLFAMSESEKTIRKSLKKGMGLTLGEGYIDILAKGVKEGSLERRDLQEVLAYATDQTDFEEILEDVEETPELKWNYQAQIIANLRAHMLGRLAGYDIEANPDLRGEGCGGCVTDYKHWCNAEIYGMCKDEGDESELAVLVRKAYQNDGMDKAIRVYDQAHLRILISHTEDARPKKGR